MVWKDNYLLCAVEETEQHEANGGGEFPFCGLCRSHWEGADLWVKTYLREIGTGVYLEKLKGKTATAKAQRWKHSVHVWAEESKRDRRRVSEKSSDGWTHSNRAYTSPLYRLGFDSWLSFPESFFLLSFPSFHSPLSHLSQPVPFLFSQHTHTLIAAAFLCYCHFSWDLLGHCPHKEEGLSDWSLTLCWAWCTRLNLV